MRLFKHALSFNLSASVDFHIVPFLLYCTAQTIFLNFWRARFAFMILGQKGHSARFGNFGRWPKFSLQASLYRRSSSSSKWPFFSRFSSTDSGRMFDQFDLGRSLADQWHPPAPGSQGYSVGGWTPEEIPAR